ncbi:MAG: hypothetical protein M3151_03680 [Actinomycetota bacterium]|nr:hypothetical protein [Actinomycetota bacterium]
MRWLKLVFASLTMALVVSTAATAQGASPQTGAVAQYDDSTGIESLADLPESLTDPAARGTGSLNEAMSDAGSSKEGAASGVDEVAGITMLPETGGAPLLALCAGVFLSGAGVLSLIRRTRP